MVETRSETLKRFIKEDPIDVWQWAYDNGLKQNFKRTASTMDLPIVRVGSWTHISNKIKHKLATRIRAQVADHILQNFDVLSFLPFSIEELVEHLGAQMTEEIGWHNPDAWHIDHIQPKSSFKFKDFNDRSFKECWSLKNLRPLPAKENLKKGRKVGKA